MRNPTFWLRMISHVTIKRTNITKESDGLYMQPGRGPNDDR